MQKKSNVYYKKYQETLIEKSQKSVIDYQENSSKKIWSKKRNLSASFNYPPKPIYLLNDLTNKKTEILDELNNFSLNPVKMESNLFPNKFENSHKTLQKNVKEMSTQTDTMYSSLEFQEGKVKVYEKLEEAYNDNKWKFYRSFIKQAKKVDIFNDEISKYRLKETTIKYIIKTFKSNNKEIDQNQQNLFKKIIDQVSCSMSSKDFADFRKSYKTNHYTFGDYSIG